MLDVGRQCNGSDGGVFTIAFAYHIRSGNDHAKSSGSIRKHLANYLEQCHLSHFPVAGERRCAGIRNTQSVDLHCSCWLSEEKGDKMVECNVCKTWRESLPYLSRSNISNFFHLYVAQRRRTLFRTTGSVPHGQPY